MLNKLLLFCILLMSCSVLPDEPEIIDSELKYGKSNIQLDDFYGRWEYIEPKQYCYIYEFTSVGKSGMIITYTLNEYNHREWQSAKNFNFDFDDNIFTMLFTGDRYCSNYNYQLGDNWFLLDSKLFTRIN